MRKRIANTRLLIIWVAMLGMVLFTGQAGASGVVDPPGTKAKAPGPGSMHTWVRPGRDIRSYFLPDTILDTSMSPNRRYVAIIVMARQGPVYYLKINDMKKRRTFFLDEQLVIGKKINANGVKVSWRNNNLILISAPAKNRRYIEYMDYNMKTGEIREGRRWLKNRYKRETINRRLKPEDLQPVRLDDVFHRLFLNRFVPMGVTYSSLKWAMPELGEEVQYIGRDLTRAYLEFTEFDHPVKVTFNFKHHELYGFYYEAVFSKEEKKDARLFYGLLKSAYGDTYGEYREHVENRTGYKVRVSNWDTRDAVIGIRFATNPQNYTITWDLH